MPSLGIGGATPYGMRSNHATALNHSFRDQVSYRPELQVKVKCTFCGCWATKGRPCYQCHRYAGGYVVPRSNSTRVTVSGMSSIRNDSAAPRTARSGPTQVPESTAVDARPSTAAQQQRSNSARPRSASATGRSNTTGTTNQSRPELSKLHRIKCKSCGCWATKRKPCGLCRTVN